MSSRPVFGDRVRRLAERMAEEGFDLFCVGASSDLFYLTGLELHPDERFKGFFLRPDGVSFAVVPRLCAEEVEEVRDVLELEVLAWDDSEGALPSLRRAFSSFGVRPGSKVAINGAVRGLDLLMMREVLDLDFADGAHVLEELREVKEPFELENLRRASEIADKAFEEVLGFIRPGVSEREIKRFLVDAMERLGASGVSFEPIVAVGAASSKPHYTGSSGIVSERDVVLLDFGCKVDGYCSDMTRTVFVGEPTPEEVEVYEAVLRAQTAAEGAVREGMVAEDLDAVARGVLERAGYGEFFLSRLGHGIGLAVHERPYIVRGNRAILKRGMCFSVEPSVSIPGRFGVRIEDLVVVEGSSPSVLNRARKDLIVL